jgi:Integrase core domain
VWPRWRASGDRGLEIDEIKTVPHLPLSHPFVERLIGTMRREFLDHILFWNSRDLERKLGEFQAYYNAARGHASLGGQTPLTFASGHTVAPVDLNMCDGSPTAGIWSSSRSRLDNEFETHRPCLHFDPHYGVVDREDCVD